MSRRVDRLTGSAFLLNLYLVFGVMGLKNDLSRYFDGLNIEGKRGYMLTDSRIREITVEAGYRDVIPGSHSHGEIARFVIFVIESNLEAALLPHEPTTDLLALARYIESVCKGLRPEITVPGVSNGLIASFVIFAKEHRLWDAFRNEAKAR